MPPTAWNLYFRFSSIAACHPHLKIDLNELVMLDKEQYKSYIKTILNADSTCTDSTSEQKYGGCDSFGGMSKDIGQQWKDADALTRAAFKELASEDMKRHKKEVFESYKAFTKKLPGPANLSEMKKLAARQKSVVTCSDNVEAMATEKNTKDVTHSKQPRIYRIDEVDMTNQEIMSVIQRVWDLENIDHATSFMCTSQEEVADFLSGIEWD